MSLSQKSLTLHMSFEVVMTRHQKYWLQESTLLVLWSRLRSGFLAHTNLCRESATRRRSSLVAVVVVEV